MLQDKESEYRAAMTQLQEAERNKERISTEMGNIQQDIDTQKVSVGVLICVFLFFLTCNFKNET